MEDAPRVLTGASSGSAWALTNCAAVALVLTGGGLGGCRRVVAKAGAAGDVRLTYSDRSISNWGTQEPTNQTRAQHSHSSSTQASTGGTQAAARWRTDTHMMTGGCYGREHMETVHRPNSVYTLTGTTI